jgi:sulfite exporter TauE/SafE
MAAWASGIALVLVGLRMTGVLKLRVFDAAGARVWRRLAPLAAGLKRVPRRARPFAAGMLWGWLPCGMAYAMLAVAAATADPGRAALLMLAFGLGTLPALLLATGFAGIGGTGASGPRLRIAGGVLLVCFGLAGIASSAWFGEPAHVHGAHAGAVPAPAPARVDDSGALASRT